MERLIFLGEWYQEEASIARKFIIYFYPNDGTIEIFDQKTKKTFLRRTRIDSVSDQDFYVGAKLNILGRQINILDFGDDATKAILGNSRKKALFMLKPLAIPIMGHIIDLLLKYKFKINNGRMLQMTSDNVKDFFTKIGAFDSELPALLNQLTRGPVVVFELIAENAVEQLKKIEYCDIPIEKFVSNENTTVEIGDTNSVRALIYQSSRESQVAEELEYFFGPRSYLKCTMLLRDSTLALIKPHCIKDGKVGKIIAEIIREEFEITALKMLVLDRSNCEEFYEVYRGVLPEYVQMVNHLCSGLCLAMEIKSKHPNRNSQEEFRKLCGPMDPEIAVQLRPHTLRAKFGKNKVFNAVHCTDLTEDTLLEIEYFFKILE